MVLNSGWFCREENLRKFGLLLRDELEPHLDLSGKKSGLYQVEC
jgi:hypothetical protein